MAKYLLALKLLLILLFWVGSASTSPSDHRYNAGDHVPLFVNKVGSLDNPSETYRYYDLPFCRPEPVKEKRGTLGEVLNGDRLVSSLYELKFREDKPKLALCRKRFKPSEVAMLRDAIARDFHFQMYYDDLPLWGFLGKVERDYLGLGEKGTKYYLFKHVQFDVLYNGERVIAIRSFSDPNHVVDISEDMEIDIEFTYSVFWNATSEGFETRMDKYFHASYLPISQDIHWFSFINSICLLVLLVGLLSLLFTRHLNNDLRSCSSADEEEHKDVAWKLIQSEVFRCPRNMTLLCAILGTGTQLLILYKMNGVQSRLLNPTLALVSVFRICSLFSLAFLGFLYPYNRGAIFTSLVIVYTLTSVIAGYTAASFHSQLMGNGWEKSIRLAGILFPGPLFITVSILNTVAITYGATAALPFGTIMSIIFVYSLLNIPFLMLGGILGYRFRSEFQAPSAIKRHPREIPLQKWYRKKPYQMFIGGLVPFSAIVLELHQFYASLWGFKIFTTPGILFLTFVVLIILTSSVGVILTYVQLSGEDHEWWWRSVLCGGSTGIFAFGYSVCFYLRSNMTGLMQLSFYFGYNACFCYALFLTLGTVSFTASWMFVRRIYRAVKSE